MAHKRLVVAGIALGAAAIAAVPAMADSQPYTGAGVVSSCPGPLVASTGIDPVDQAQQTDGFDGGGAHCFTNPGDQAYDQIDTSVVDDSGQAVAYGLQFSDADGNATGDPIDVCPGDSGTVALPTGTTYVYIFVDDPAVSTLACGGPSVATTGTMNLTWIAPAPVS